MLGKKGSLGCHPSLEFIINIKLLKGLEKYYNKKANLMIFNPVFHILTWYLTSFYRKLIIILL